ncbi:ATP-grasp domain-containing protein [Kitasatospora sp. A2-31]|uniref:ATP-grasp domain-containing protein n=1 Tax=Kitasatospora sp. A2-31 TaxID=2916414 RepID=UPI001EECAB92|nr:ATP-grasp domain-containing protein [Kitasatospora sp. A2-31]MCG6495827.1 ATP-grasp domain-containing protein [Kitasatospora sp. A2-31]
MTAQDLVLFLGNARYGEFEPLRDAGYRVGLIRDVRSHGWCADDGAFDVVVPWDPAEGVEPLAARLGEEPGVCVLNLREAYVEPYARLLTVLGLPALPEAEVAGLRSKELMRRLFTERIGPDSTGRFGPAESVQDVLDFGEAHGWPVVVKPAALYSSLFVLTVPGPEAAAETFEHIRGGVADHVRGKGLPERFTALQVEEFLAGSNHSVDLVVDRDGTPWPSPVVDVLTGADLGGDDFHHFARFAPSLAGEEHRRTMAELAVAAVRAMGLRLCAAHVEFILTAKGPRLLEVGVRPGGHRARVLHQAHGISFMAAYAAVLRGERPDLEARFDRPFGIVTPFPRVTGVFTGLNGFDRVTALPTYARHSLYHAPGVIAGTAAEGHWQVLSAELTAEGADDLQRDIGAVWEMADLVLTRPQGGAAERRRDRPHLLVVGGKDSGFRSMAELDARITLLQQRANLSDLQRERADGLFVQEELDGAWARSLAEQLHGAGTPFDAVVSFAEPHLLTAALIGESLGIAHNPVPAVERSRDKTRMRALLAEHGLPSVRYRPCGAADEAARFQRELDAPVIVKPADGSGSRGVTLARGPEEAAEAWRRAAAAGGAVIAEEFVTGRELSVETLTLDGKHELVAVTEKITSGAPSFVETGHQLPAALDAAATQAVEETVVALLEALGHRWGPAHTEVMLRSDGSPVVIETQTRFGGDQIWEMVELVTGVPLAAATAAGMLGLDGRFRRTPAGGGAAIRFFAHENVEVLAVDGIDAARELPGVVTVKAAAQPGRRLGPLTGSGSRQGYVLAVGADRGQAVARAEAAWQAVDFRLAPVTDGGAHPTS